MDHLRTEASNPASINLDELTPLQLVRLMNAEDALIIPAVASQAEAIARAIEIIAERLKAGGRLIYAGAGTSGRLGVLDAAECPPTFNSAPEQVLGLIAGGQAALTRAVEGAEDRAETAESDLLSHGLNRGDVLVGIATSGRTPYVLRALAFARAQGAFTVGLACNPDAELIGNVDLAITPVVGPEVLSGSTRLKAGTATKLVLNMLSTGAMVKLNKTFGNLMVDLRVTNLKLAARANRIIRHLTGSSQNEAERLLSQCGGEVKTALVVRLAGLTPQEARHRLQLAGGRVRQILPQGPKTDPRVAIASQEGGDSIDFSQGQVKESLAAGTASNSNSNFAEVGRVFLGVDGGGTHTVALVGRALPPSELSKATDSGRSKLTILGRGQAGPSNIQAVGSEKAFAAIDQAVAEALAMAELSRSLAGRPLIAAACLGLAGAGRPEDQAFIRAWADRIGLAATTEVTTDARLLLAAGTPDDWGIAVIAGTGSMVFARNREGQTARAGGWGRLLGDEGSGYAIALAGLRAVARAADGREKATALTHLLLSALNLKVPQDLIAAVYRQGITPVELAGHAPVVLTAAEGGDSVATELVQKAALVLAETVAAAARKLDLWQFTQAPASESLPIVLAGGLFAASLFYRGAFLQALASVGVTAAPVSLVQEPAEGALRLAMNLGNSIVP